MVLSWGRAILLQVAHPKVAAGDAEHSSFSDDPRANRARLDRTIQAMLSLTFGSTDEAALAASRINRIHDRVNGQLTSTTGRHTAGDRYSAHMPDLLLWVHATFLDSALLVYQRFVEPLTVAEQDRYCDESRALGPWLGIPIDTMPATRADLDGYMAAALSGDGIRVGDDGRRLGTLLLTARPSWAVRGPVLALLHWPTIGLLPPPIRSDYGLSWTARQETVLQLMAATSRCLAPLTPAPLRFWPIALRAAVSDTWPGP